jgi:hypothetical protein
MERSSRKAAEKAANEAYFAFSPDTSPCTQANRMDCDWLDDAVYS